MKKHRFLIRSFLAASVFYTPVEANDSQENPISQLYDPISGAIVQDMPRVLNIFDILGDPAVKRQLRRNNVNFIITDDDIDNITAGMKRKNPFEDIYNTSARELISYAKDFLVRLERSHPKVKSTLRSLIHDNEVTLRIQSENMGVSFSNANLQQNALVVTAGIFLGNVQPYVAMSNATFNLKEGDKPDWKKSDYERLMSETVRRTVTEYQENIGLLLPKVGSEKAVGVFIDELQKLDFYTKSPPGEPEHYDAFVMAHEIEHVLGNGQIGVNNAHMKVMENLEESENITFKDSFSKYFKSQLREIDADIGAINALKGQVPYEVFEYIVSIRIATQNIIGIYNSFFDAGTERASFESDEKTLPPPSQTLPIDVLGEYDIGFHVMEYVDTGVVPSYTEIQSAVIGFYRTTAHYYLQKLEAQFDSPQDLQEFRGNYYLINVPDSQEHLGIVSQALEDGIYPPEQARIAKMLIHSLFDVLGAEIIPMNKTMEKDLKEYNEGLPDILPDKDTASEYKYGFETSYRHKEPGPFGF